MRCANVTTCTSFSTASPWGSDTDSSSPARKMGSFLLHALIGSRPTFFDPVLGIVIPSPCSSDSSNSALTTGSKQAPQTHTTWPNRREVNQPQDRPASLDHRPINASISPHPLRCCRGVWQRTITTTTTDSPGQHLQNRPDTTYTGRATDAGRHQGLRRRH